MRNVHTIVKKPLFTEKGARIKEAENKVLVEVAKDANKIEIKRAVEEIFNVKVASVATITTNGKWKKHGRSIGRRPDKKKAIITLKKGEKLDFIEGA
jgi:large subunit ribosomal protein L23